MGRADAEHLFPGHADLARAVAYLRQQGARYPQGLEQGIVPPLGVDVEEQGARGVGGVGHVHLPTAEPPDQEAVDGAEGEPALLRALAGAGHVVEDPGHLGAREVGIQAEPRLLLEERAPALGLERGALRGGAPVLPHDRGVYGRPALPIPHHCGLALVGDPDRGHRSRRVERLAAHRQRGLPDLLRVVLDPARPRVVLGELALGDSTDVAAACIEDDGPAAGGALVDGEDARFAAHRAAHPLTVVARFNAPAGRACTPCSRRGRDRRGAGDRESEACC